MNANADTRKVDPQVFSRFQSRDSVIVALLAKITIVTRNFFHPKRGSIPACLVSDSNLLCSQTRDCHVMFTFLCSDCYLTY